MSERAAKKAVAQKKAAKKKIKFAERWVPLTKLPATPKQLRGRKYAEEFWEDAGSQLVEKGYLTKANALVFSVVCAVYEDLMTGFSKGSSAGRVNASLVKVFQNFSADFLLPARFWPWEPQGALRKITPETPTPEGEQAEESAPRSALVRALGGDEFRTNAVR
jgi:hypothetical protein